MFVLIKTKEEKNREFFLLSLIVLFAVILRIFTAQMIGIGGMDAVESWDAARRILLGADYNLIHRTARFGTIIPIYLTQLIFGIKPVVYYIAPAVASVLQAVLFFKIASLIRGKGFAFISTLILLSFPQMIREASHPRVSVFSSLYFLAAFYLCLKYFIYEKSKHLQRTRYLPIAGIFVFLMYLAKEDALYFLPVLLLMVYAARRSFTDLMIFSSVPLVLFIIETYFYSSFGYPLGRLSLIQGQHFDTVPPLSSYVHVFDRFSPEFLKAYFRIPLFISLAAGAAILIKKRFKMSAITFVILSLVAYLSLLTFPVKSLDPILPLNTFRTRYLSIIIPQMILILTYFFHEITVWLCRNRHYLFHPGKLFITGATALYLIITIAVFIPIYMHDFYPSQGLNYFKVHPFRLVTQYNSIIEKAERDKKIIMIRGVPEGRDRFLPVVRQINAWVKKGQPLETACSRFKISIETYKKYKAASDTHVRFTARFPYVFVFFTPGKGKSEPEKFYLKVKNNPALIIYDASVDRKDMLASAIIKNQSTPVIEISTEPLMVRETTARDVLDFTEIRN